MGVFFLAGKRFRALRSSFRDPRFVSFAARPPPPLPPPPPPPRLLAKEVLDPCALVLNAISRKRVFGFFALIS